MKNKTLSCKKPLTILSYIQISNKFKQFNSKSLPGISAQKKMSPPFRSILKRNEFQKLNPKLSSVIILIYEKENKPYIILTERTIYKGAHSGQISFPGGKKENQDKNLEETALRETFEEIGVLKKNIEIIQELTQLYIPVSNYLVSPYVALHHDIPKFKKDDYEVESILEIPVHDFFDDKNVGEKKIHNEMNQYLFSAPSYNILNKEIWGATAMIISEFIEILLSE